MLIIPIIRGGNSMRAVRDAANRPWNLNPDALAFERLSGRLDRMAVHCRALWSFVSATYGITEEELTQRMESLSQPNVSACSTCGRPVARNQHSCLYCGEANPDFTPKAMTNKPGAAETLMAVTGPGKTTTEQDADKLKRLDARVDQLALAYQAIWSFVAEKDGLTQAQLGLRVEEITASARITGSCTSCGRAFASRQPNCVYCGSPRTDTSPFDAL